MKIIHSCEILIEVDWSINYLFIRKTHQYYYTEYEIYDKKVKEYVYKSDNKRNKNASNEFFKKMEELKEEDKNSL